MNNTLDNINIVASEIANSIVFVNAKNKFIETNEIKYIKILENRIFKIYNILIDLKSIDLDKLKNRLYCKKFFKRKLIESIHTKYEKESAKSKKIGKNEIYINEKSMKLIEMQDKKNEFFSKKRILVNSKNRINLKSNDEKQKSRNNEIYSLAKGIEKYAEKKSFTWGLITLTLPGEWHPNPKYKNKYHNWNGKTSSESNQELQRKWRNWQRDLKRSFNIEKGNDFFAIKIVEAHKDGTPHWHILTFCKKEKKEDIENSFLKHFKNTKKRKLKKGSYVWNDDLKNKSTKACSYIFKYIFKSNYKDNDYKRLRNWRRAGKVIRTYSTIGVNSCLFKIRIINKIAYNISENDNLKNTTICNAIKLIKNKNIKNSEIYEKFINKFSEKIKINYGEYTNKYNEKVKKAISISDEKITIKIPKNFEIYNIKRNATLSISESRANPLDSLGISEKDRNKMINNE